MTERRYRMIRLGAGDYLLPSNDGNTLWRFRTYEEDGSAEDWTGRKVVGTYWAIWKWDGEFPTFDQFAAALENDDDFSRWLFWAGPFNKRADAIDDAIGRNPS